MSKPVTCIFCKNDNSLRKHGKSRAKIQRYYCLSCNKTFQGKYIYHKYISTKQVNAISIQ